MFWGLTIANIGGVPAATCRPADRLAHVPVGTSLIGVVAIAALWFALPKGERGRDADVRREFRVPTRLVLVAMTTTVIVGGGDVHAIPTSCQG